MASSSVDVASLNSDQQAALEQYMSFTNQDIEEAVPLLQRSQWNVQIAISRFFDGEPETDPVAEALQAQASQSDHRVHEILTDTFASPSRLNRLPPFRPAPRIVPPPNPEIQYRPGFPFNIIFGVFSLGTSAVSRVFRIISSFIPFLPALLARLQASSNSRSSNRRPLLPQDTASRFIREFEEEYGDHKLPFLVKGYAHSLDQAKRELKYLLVVLLSPEHDDTHDWVKNTLLSPDVVSFLSNPENNILLWGGTVQDSEAYQISNAFNVTKFPYAALIAQTSQSGSSRPLSSSGMSIIAPLSGLLPPTELISRIRSAMEAHSSERNKLRADLAEREATRSMRMEQDDAYERSLARDREKARQRREEEERKKREAEQAALAERERDAAKQKAEDWKLWRAARLVAEPLTDDKTAARVSVRMPNGERLVRRFPGDANIEEIYAFVECWDVLKDGETSKEVEKPVGYEHTYGFRLVSPMPRTVYTSSETGSIKSRIGRSANLIVEAVEDDDDEEEE